MTHTTTILGMAYEVQVCITCGVPIIVPAERIAFARRVGGYYHCTNGHQQGWSGKDSEEAIVRRERDRLKQMIAQKDDEIAERDRRLAEQAKAAAKVKKRIAAGVCQCCNRSFRQLTLHMKRQHPKFVAEAVN